MESHVDRLDASTSERLERGEVLRQTHRRDHPGEVLGGLGAEEAQGDLCSRMQPGGAARRELR